jgi:hypothetical protein
MLREPCSVTALAQRSTARQRPLRLVARDGHAAENTATGTRALACVSHAPGLRSANSRADLTTAKEPNMKVADVSLQQMEHNARMLRKLRAGLHGERLDDPSDVSSRSLDGRPNGNDPHAQSRTIADYFRTAQAMQPAPDWP